MSVQLLIFDNVTELKEFYTNFSGIDTCAVMVESPKTVETTTTLDEYVETPPEEVSEERELLPDYDKTYDYNAISCGFKTKKGKKQIWLSGTEGLDILEYTYQGKKPKWIFYNMEFTHDVVTKSTIYNFIRRCKEGKMDYAIKNVCENPRINEDFSKYSMILKKLQE